MNTIYKEPDFEIYDAQGTWYLATEPDEDKLMPDIEGSEKDIFYYLDPIVNVLFWVTIIGLPLYLIYHVALSVLKGVWP